MLSGGKWTALNEHKDNIPSLMTKSHWSEYDGDKATKQSLVAAMKH